MAVTVRVSFMGICTHIWEDQPNALPNPAYGKRIVIPNASDPTLINEKYNFTGPNAIQPHAATLYVLKGAETIQLSLEGVTVTIPTDQITPIQKDARCMPGLGSFVSDLAPGPAATTPDPALAYAWFDFQTGTVLGRGLSQFGGAASILYETTISDPNLEPMVVLTPFDGSPAIEISLATEFPDIACPVVITNFAGDDPDNANDFLLHYLVGGAWPATPPVIGPVGCTQHPNAAELLAAIGEDIQIGMGCSNSNFP
jgi:hypothetical protein